MSNHAHRHPESPDDDEPAAVTGPPPGLGYDPGREGSPYTFEGAQARGWNVIGSLLSPDPVFRRKAQLRFFVGILPTLIAWLAVLIFLAGGEAHPDRKSVV